MPAYSSCLCDAEVAGPAGLCRDHLLRYALSLAVATRALVASIAPGSDDVSAEAVERASMACEVAR